MRMAVISISAPCIPLTRLTPLWMKIGGARRKDIHAHTNTNIHTHTCKHKHKQTMDEATGVPRITEQ